MRTNTFVGVIIIAVTLLLLGFGLLQVFPKSSEIDIKVSELTPSNEQKSIKTNLLNDKIIRDIEAYPVFGERPITVGPDTINRPNPFGGL